MQVLDAFLSVLPPSPWYSLVTFALVRDLLHPPHPKPLIVKVSPTIAVDWHPTR